MNPWENLPAGPTRSRQPGNGIFNRMTRPPSTPVGTPPFGDPASYRTQIQDQSGGVIGQNMGTTRGSPLGDLGMYLTSNPFKSWKTGDGAFDESGFMSYNQFNGVPLYRKNDQGGWEINPEGRLAELNKQFQGLDFRLENDPYADDYEDGRPSLNLKWNHEALPRDKFGNYGTGVGVEGYEDGRLGNLRNPNAVYDDPFYGRITDRRNLQQHENWFDKFNDMLTGSPLLLSLVTMGLGGALGGAGALAGGISPSTALSLGTGAAGAMNGDYGRILQTIANMALPGLGLSGMPLNMARMGTGFFTNMFNNRGGRG